jgi:hypothetical protein
LELVLDNGEHVPIRHPEAALIITEDDIAVVDNGQVYFIGPEAVSMIVQRRRRPARSS